MVINIVDMESVLMLSTVPLFLALMTSMVDILEAVSSSCAELNASLQICTTLYVVQNQSGIHFKTKT